ncbi:alpha/beta fold hydrolase [Micromonosporaceae bacterium DT194]|uniref:alpha/beta fold hydrolase n=1 Tax=Melissospora conviva TaxID=3388432 RepID=UPI003C169005
MKRRPARPPRRLPAGLDRSTVLNWTERIGSVTHLLASLEYLTRGRDRQRGGPNNWAVNRRTFRTHAPRATRVLDLFADQRVVTALHAGRAVAAAALWLPLTNRQRVVANAVLTGSQGALHAQHLYGSDGADQVSFLVQALTTVARAGRNRPAVVDAALWFLSLQSVLSYTVSGWAKLPSETWRSGRALPGIVRTITYGDKQAWELMRRFPRLTKLTAHGVLAMECAFPLVYAAKGRPAPYLLAAAGAFHLANSRVMGLGRFFWAFTSTYPAVVYTTRPRERTGVRDGIRRDDTLPALAAAAGAALFAAGQAARIRRRRIIERGRGDEQTFVTTAGNTLSYRYAGSGPIPSDGPVLLLENGLASTAEHWERIAAPLGEQFTTVTYQRAGYGASRYHRAGEYRFDTMVDDLTELARHVAGDRPLVLAGHSLGGYLSLLAAERLAGQVRGVALVDSSHPAELRRSPRQAEGSRALTETLTLMPGSIRAGLGSLLPRPAWADRMPEPVRDLALAQYRDPALWSAARREWKVVRERFDAETGLPRIDVPLVVITAGQTARTDAVQAELHDEFAAAAPRAQRHTIDDADHDEILTDAASAAEVVDILTAFVADVTDDAPHHGDPAGNAGTVRTGGAR